MEMASKSLTRVTLELGGNDAAVILEDAIIDDTHLDRLFAAIYDTTGQICMNAKRVFVHRSRMDEVVERARPRASRRPSSATASTKARRWGRCTRPSRRLSSTRLIQEAKDAGADVREFGELPGGDLAGGNFVRPTIVVEPRPEPAGRDPGAVRPGHPVDPVRHRGRSGHDGERHLGRPVRLGLDGEPRDGQPRRLAAGAAATSGSTTTAHRDSTCVPRSAA